MLLVAALLPPQAVLGRSASSPGLSAAHERLVERPADQDRLYAYARAAIREGNFEAAVSALEGLLVISRDQPRVLLELGALYRRMGAPRVAEAYLRRARELAGEGTQIASLADAYLREAERETSRSGWSGFVRFGLRYQSNPTLSPESDEILSQAMYFARRPCAPTPPDARNCCSWTSRL
jgi:tetratricopeptide (TPR) repeat protein